MKQILEIVLEHTFLNCMIKKINIKDICTSIRGLVLKYCKMFRVFQHHFHSLASICLFRFSIQSNAFHILCSIVVCTHTLAQENSRVSLHFYSPHFWAWSNAQLSSQSDGHETEVHWKKQRISFIINKCSFLYLLW